MLQNTNHHGTVSANFKVSPVACLLTCGSLPAITFPAIPQEFRALSASWDSTKHLSMGKLVLQASLSGLLRNLAHDESAKQVRASLLFDKDAGCLEWLRLLRLLSWRKTFGAWCVRACDICVGRVQIVELGMHTRGSHSFWLEWPASW